MSDTSPAPIKRPPRNLSATSLGFHLFGLSLKRHIRSRKTLFLFLVQLIPVVLALFSRITGNGGGLAEFEATFTQVYLPYLLPLAALFFGGPTVVDEVEGRTITYLTLRPLSRSTLFLSKLATSIALAIVVTVIPVILFFAVSVIGSADPMGGSLATLGAAIASTVGGATAYTAIFALLGVIFASTLLPGIVYYLVFEIILGALPVIEFISIKFHVFTLGGFRRGVDGEERLRDEIARFLLDQPLEFDWWVGLLCLIFVTTAAVVLSATVFRNRQFHV